MRKHLALAALAVVSALAVPHQSQAKAAPGIVVCDRQGCRAEAAPASPAARGARATKASRTAGRSRRSRRAHRRPSLAFFRHGGSRPRFENDPRPSAWCGWWLRHQLGVADRALNRAIRWARFGQPAHGPAEGVIVVWPHHVGIITGRAGGHWIVKSGNDGHRVRERPRSLAGVVAFRRQNGMAGL